MTRITLNSEAAKPLYDLTLPVEICDSSGQVLGQFIPRINMAEWEMVGPEISEEELDRIAQSNEWYTTEQVLAHLKSLENQ